MSDTILKPAKRFTFTFTKVARPSACLFLLLAGLLTGDVLHAEEITGTDPIQSAQAALSKGQKRRADFLIARYLGLCETAAISDCDESLLDPYLEKRKLTPKAFIPSDWNADFIQWLQRGIRSRWGITSDRVREKYRSFEIANVVHEDKYFITVTIVPEIELWYTTENGIVSKPLVMTMGSSRERPVIFFGKTLKGQRSSQFTSQTIDTRNRTLHYFWKPEFHDADGDGQVEVWLRYNLSWGNGFSQFMEIYSIKEERELVLLHRCQALNEGFVRRLSDGTVELGTGSSSSGRNSRMDHDEHHLETWAFENGAFIKRSESKRSFIPRSDDWPKYYLETPAR